MTLTRRDFLGAVAAVPLLGKPGEPAGEIVTVTGPISASEAGIVLPHEHVMSLFGADLTERPAYDREALFDAVVPYLRRLRNLGCGTLADCTTAYFGRAPELLREISQLTGVRILTNTGYYAAAGDRYVPARAREASPESIAATWIDESRHGIGESGIRPGFIKTGVDDGPLSELDARMVRAAAMTHRETGLTIAVHTGANPDSAAKQLGILKEEGVSPQAWIWVHANAVADPSLLLPAAEAGAWIELDGVSEASAEEHLGLLNFLRERGFSKQVLLSHDGNSFRFGGRPPKPYDGLFTRFLPLLRERDFNEEEIRQLVSENPFRALIPSVRQG